MKGSVVGKMPGDYTNQLRCTRGFYAYLLAHPGKKLLFMGAELGQWHEWNDKESLDWYLLENEENQKIHRFFKEANDFYKKEPALWEIDFDWEGFEWLVVDDNHNNDGLPVSTHTHFSQEARLIATSELIVDSKENS